MWFASIYMVEEVMNAHPHLEFSIHDFFFYRYFGMLISFPKHLEWPLIS